MNKKIVALTSLVTSVLLPLSAFAYTSPPPPGSFTGGVDAIIGAIFDIFWPIVAAFVIVMFTIAGFKFLTAQGDPSRIKEGRDAVIWGVAGVGVILIAWSIISIVSTALNV